MTASTPILHLRVDEELFHLYTEDYTGNRNLVAMCPNAFVFKWLVDCMASYHKVKVLRMDEK